ncbi:MAG: S8 family serine peptidase [Bacteroidales bacterium]|nr:S8 family serine peptidase [Bacteroidales bacterium]
MRNILSNCFPVRNVLNIAILTFLLSWPLSGSSAKPDGTVVRGERPPVDILSVPQEAIEQGIIRIKFSAALENLLDHGLISSDPDGSVRFGISGVDQLNQQFGVVGVKKTFDAALQNTKYAERHRQWGFHLWYDLLVPAGTDIRNMVLAYASINEIQVSEPVYRKEHTGYKMNPQFLTSPEGDNTGLTFVPNDPSYNEQWHYHNTGQQGGTPDADIDLPEAWDIVKGNSDVIVAVVDDGIDYNHPDLVSNMWPGVGYNFITNSATIVPGNHGTHVAGTIAANTGNNTGVSGIAGGDGSGNGVRLMSCQVFDGSSNGGFHTAPVYAADNGAAISQNSWAYTVAGYYEQAVLDAIDYFNANGGGTVLDGGITIFAAGNTGSNGIIYPGYYSGSLTVASTNNEDVKSYYSTYGTWIDISAPGGETNVIASRGVLSTLTNGTYGFLQGTSMACPHVSGVAALIVSLLPGILSPDELRDILVNTTDDIYALNPTYTGQLGSGRLNAYQALLLAQQYIVPTAAFSASSNLGCTGSAIGFTDHTLAPVTSWTWSFPGGNPSGFSGQYPPPIQYSSPGLYDVSLTVSDGVSSDTETKTSYIEIRDVITDFTASNTSITGGGSVTFTDLTSCNPDSWEWSFPGGTPSYYSGQTPPPVVYSFSGTYDVSLTASKNGSSDTKTLTSLIHVAPPQVNMHTGMITTCDALFYDSGGPSGNYQNYQNHVLTIYPASAGTAVRLNFTSFFLQNNFDNLYIYNGTSTSDPLLGSFTGQTGPGTITSSHYTGALTVRFQSDCCGNNPGWSATISCFSAPPIADFSTTNITPAVGEVTMLLDQSANVPASWNWSISPSSFNYLNGTDQSARNPEIQFNAPGAYTISLEVSNDMGTNSIIRTEYIIVSPAASCVPAYSTGSSAGDFISLVQLEGISNASGASPLPSYTDYSNLTANLIKGSSYTLTLSGGTQGAANTVAVWIDYNQDNQFDPSEKLGNVALPAAPGTTDLTFSIPQQANNGTAIMRVRAVREVSEIDPCSLYSHGETEDYRVLISPVAYCEPSFDNGSIFGNYISLVQLEEINNITGATPYPSYTYYDGVTANLNLGSEYTLTLSAGTNSNNYMSAWIDFNNNSEFEESERLGFISSPESPANETITFTVPEDAAVGTTRLRVIEAYLYEYSEYGPCDYYPYGEAEDYPVNISGSSKSIQITVFLEGLYEGSATMNQANNELGPEYEPGIADQVTVEFHNAADYTIIEHSVSNVNLGTNGQLSMILPGFLNGSYYVTIRHRNSLETTSALPVSFAVGPVSADFTDQAGVYGGNLLQMTDGAFVIYGGDVNQDGAIDTADMTPVDNDSGNYLSGYLVTDVNGDGVVDTADMTIVDNNSANYIQSAHP